MDKNLPIDLSNDEHLVTEISRSAYGVLGIYLTTLIITFSCLVAAYIIQDGSVLGESLSQSSALYLSLGAALIGLLSLIFGFIAGNIYWENRMFITNEAVHQVVRRGLFDKSNQRIALYRVESAKANQKTMAQRLLGYGTLTFATEGEDVNYVISYVKNPSQYTKIFYDTQEQKHQEKAGQKYQK